MTLQVALERPLPTTLEGDRGDAVFVAGTCAAHEGALKALALRVDGEAHPIRDFAMARGGARTGFWTTARIGPQPAGTQVSLTLEAELAGGGTATAPLGSIAVARSDAPAPAATRPPADNGLIAVCMATYEPDMALFATQVRSLREQTDTDWVCVISDDGSSPARLAEIEAELAGDERFTLSPAAQRVGFYRNFERAIGLAPPQAQLIALCDQDDRWHPDKLATLRAAIGDAVLVYSDLRLVEADGRLLRDTLWRGRANNYTDLAAMLVANTITGASALFCRDLLPVLLPFPDTPGFQFHDHWLAMAALASGPVAYVDRPLYDYVQHRGAVFGHVTHGERTTGGARGPITRVLGGLRGAPERWRAAYFYGYQARSVAAEVLLARLGAAAEPAKRRTLERFVAAERSGPALAWLALQPLRMAAGHTETLASELELAKGLVWERVARVGARRGQLPAALIEASPPPLDAFSQKRLRRWRAAIGEG